MAPKYGLTEQEALRTLLQENDGDEKALMAFLEDIVFSGPMWTTLPLPESHRADLVVYLLNYYLMREVNGTVGHWVHLLAMKAVEVSAQYAVAYSKVDWAALVNPQDGYSRTTGSTLDSNDTSDTKSENSGSQDAKNGDYPYDVDVDDNDQHKSHSAYAGDTTATNTRHHSSAGSGTQVGRNATAVENVERQLGLVYNIDTALVMEFEPCYNILV